jgi:uncharacterized protein
MSGLKREVATWSRWLHIYLSMFSFTALLFFAVTGITLNHTNWIEGQQKVEQLEANLPLDWVHKGAIVNKLNVVEHLRNKHYITSPLSDFATDETECSISFKGPGFSANVLIDRETGHYLLTITKSGLIAVMNDLHKGRDSGQTWAWLIDISAALMGFVMIFFLKKKRASGLLITGLGAIALVLIYYFTL